MFNLQNSYSKLRLVNGQQSFDFTSENAKLQSIQHFGLEIIIATEAPKRAPRCR